jgi:acyl carrier protein
VPSETDATQGQLGRADVLDLIRQELAEILEVDPGSIAESDSFAEDLHLGSLHFYELAEAIEERFGDHRPGFKVEDEDLEGLKSVRDAVDYVIARL